MRLKVKAYNAKKHPLPRFAQGKWDGHFTTFTKRNGTVAAWTSAGHDLASVLSGHDYRWWRELEGAIAEGETIHGELCAVGQPAEKVKTALKWGDPTSVGFFATSLCEPHAHLSEVESAFTDRGLTYTWWVETEGLNAQQLRVEALNQGFTEGIVLKNGNYTDWLKSKNQRTIDVICSGFKEGRKRFIGLVGSIVCKTTEGHIVCNCSGMDDFTRLNIDEDDDLGRVLEVQYDRVGSNGKLRFPQFLRWRDDKVADECGVDQDPELEEYWSD